ncbi:MAG: hypothetical protein ACT4R6_11635 [Gemmatimonadaceae bacterium]
MLAYLESLCTALVARETQEVLRLLRHPLANALPADVRDEALTIARGGARTFVAPIHTLRLYHQTAHLLGVSDDPGARLRKAAAAQAGADQIELPLDRVAAR